MRQDGGYDGQFYFYAAHDPFMNTDHFKAMDFARYRYRRIAYPLLVNMVSFGSPQAIPYCMVLVNILAIALGTFFIGRIAEYYGQSVWYSLLYGLIPGLFLAVTRNLTEPLQMASICGALYFYICKRSFLLTSLFLTIAALSKSTALLIPFAIILHELLFQKDKREFWLLFCPFLLYSLWYIYVEYKIDGPIYDFHLTASGYSSLYFVPLYPFLKILSYKISTLWKHNSMTHIFYDISFTIACFSSIVLAFKSIFKISLQSTLPLLSFALLSIFIADPWADYFSFTRTLAPLYLLLLIYYLNTREKIFLLPFFISTPALLLFIAQTTI